MATRIRLQRRGRKGYAFYSIVIADARAPRDGRFIEKIGTYNPNTNPAAVDLNFERALHWVLVGAQPTDTVRNLLSREGVYMKKHLLGGVAKGAFNEAEAETKFEAWKNDKQNGLKALKDKIDADKKAAAKVRLEAEKKVNEEIAAKVAEKKAAEAATKAAEEAATKAAEEAATKVAEAEEAKAEEAKVAEEAQATEETTATLPTEEAAPVEEAPKTEA
ncbi:30S ribosomal protein S16 [Phocaeicola abscessus]|uniref:30S ribosomal protein S16 n=1 Tax=Phocaeicola abscessus TaxID=555313 RepID=UPI0004B88639|nr:30S ribosomal protein S16 [Phocaeicola abscessus]